MLWGRRAGKDESGRVRKLPALIQEGLVLGDLVEIEDWNEYGELKQHVKIYYDEFTIPNIHHKHPEPVFKKRPVKKSATAGAAASASAAASTAASTSASGATSAKPAPVPPPMPEPKAATATAPSEKKTAADKPAQAGKEKTLPVRSFAEEAAAKAKELRLKSLREKVHGKEGAAEIAKAKKAEAEGKPPSAPAAAAASTPAKKVEEEDEDDDDDDDEDDDSDDSSEESSEEDSEEDSSDEDEAPKTQAKPKPLVTKPSEASSSPTTKPPGLQSPTSSAWRHGSQSDDLARDALQSPTSGKWTQGATVGETLGTHNGAEVRSASEAEIKALEKENVIKEEPELEEKEDTKA